MRRLLFAMIGLSVCLGGRAFAQDTVFQPTFPKRTGLENNTRIVIPPLLHPEVAVSRTLAAQPVHPHMAQVVIGGINHSAAMSTWIDPYRRLVGEGLLDENHSLARAQRLFYGLRGVSSSDLDAARNASLALEPRVPGSFRVIHGKSSPRLYRPMRAADESLSLPVLILPNPATPRDDRPQGEPRHRQRRFDIRVAPEHPKPDKGAKLAESSKNP